MLRYLDNGDDVNVGSTELQERLEVPVKFGISIQQVAQQGRNEMARRFLKYSDRKKKKCVLPAGPVGAAKWLKVDLERRCQDISRVIQTLNKRRNFLKFDRR